jgi:hypothetical protein
MPDHGGIKQRVIVDMPRSLFEGTVPVANVTKIRHFFGLQIAIES